MNGLTFATLYLLTFQNKYCFMQIPVHRYIIKGYDWVILNGPKVLIALILFFVGLWFINIISSLLKRAFSKREFDPTV